MTEADSLKEKKAEFKVDFEGAWKELFAKVGGSVESGSMVGTTIGNDMLILENKYRKLNIFSERVNAGKADFFSKKSTEFEMENTHLKKSLREAKRELVGMNAQCKRIGEGIIFDSHRYPRHVRYVRVKPKPKLCSIELVGVTDNFLEITLNLDVTEKKYKYYRKALEEGEDISWHGLKMKVSGVTLYLPSRKDPRIVDIKRRNVKCV